MKIIQDALNKKIKFFAFHFNVRISQTFENLFVYTLFRYFSVAVFY